MRDLGRDEQHRGRVLTGGDARAAADAGGRVHRRLGIGLGDRQRIPVRSASGIHGNKSARLHDALHRTAVDNQVLDDREGAGAPRLDVDVVSVFEAAHVGLAGGDPAFGPVSRAIDHERTGPTDPLAAVVVEGDWVLSLFDEPLVHHVQHLREGHVRADVSGLVLHHPPFIVRAALSPDVKRDVHYL